MSDMQRRILLVEDEESLAESIRYSLEQDGFTVTLAVDGRKAIERFRSDAPDLVILDLMLPELSGLDVCRLIREESNVPIVMVTAKDSEADKVAGLELGADDYVTKPFSIRELVSRVRAHLRRLTRSPGSSFIFRSPAGHLGWHPVPSALRRCPRCRRCRRCRRRGATTVPFQVIPRELIFYDLLDAAARNVADAAGELLALVADLPHAPPHAGGTRPPEHAGGDPTPPLIPTPNTTFWRAVHPPHI